jgi:hypothetical protein
MTQQYIQVGTAPNDGLGDPIRTAFIKSNDNFSQLYARAQVAPPPTLIGSIGDQAGWYAYDSSYFYYCFANYNGSSIIWAQITQIGNISVPTIQNGNSNVAINGAGSNVTISVNGVTDVAVFSTIGANITGYLAVSGNITSGNISVTDNINTSNVIATGNITGNYFIGNGSQLTGIPAVYGNANVAAFLPTYTGILSPSAVYTDGYYWANSTPIDFGGGNYNNANVAAFLPTYTGNISGDNISLAGNVDVAGNVNGVVNGQLYGLVNGVNLDYGTWDFGYIVANTYTNPLQWIFALTPAGNVDMGTVTAPTSLDIDIGTLF